MALAPVPVANGERLSGEGWEVFRSLRRRGASFAQELVARTGLSPARVERGLAELVSWGLVTSDGMAGLRVLLAPARRAARARGSRGRRLRAAVGAQAPGRWSLLRAEEQQEEEEVGARQAAEDGLGRRPQAAEQERREVRVERLARQLLARYGIVVRGALEREPLLPPWREMLRVLRRLEMRGEIRGGRFLAGASGEQFALPEALDLLRAVRRQPPEGGTVVLSAGDPLNLSGIVTPGERVPSLPWNHVLYRDGVPVAVRERGVARPLDPRIAADELRGLLGPAWGRASAPAEDRRERAVADLSLAL